MSEPLTPRLEQVRQAILQLLGDPDATLADVVARLVDILNEELNNGAHLNNIYAQMQDVVYPWVDPDAPAPGEPWALHNWRRGTEFLAAFAAATANQSAADSEAALHLPSLATILATLEATRLVTVTASNRLSYTPAGGGAAQSAAVLLAEISAKLSALVTGQTTQLAALDVMNDTLSELLACCQEGNPEPIPTYPTGACPGYDLHFEARGWSALAYDATSYPTHVAYKYVPDAETAPGWLKVVTTAAGGTWFTNLELATRQFCVVFNEDINLAGTWYVQQMPAGLAGPQGFIDFDGGTGQQWGQTQTLVNILGRYDPEPPAASSYQWYRFVRYSPSQANPPYDRPGMWVNVDPDEPV